ncbi:hypothetical protein K437DRAFT_254482 [Tilletiaria anomala UBC 951]|uniref:Uncharacterized protein n=1 Tax=Tilletiaria anomala (strain ATCC 24038 / CBS 436.72 / UBC 951) TaxID=1037660 RepID=A0A066WMQ2_TILAU|nr:uncharacterized protein K437DRAFT_254482 [Tilletiaria anomala UBC 951]KDN52284.1 hypothetical protein K437DRAFT_254482 [Tilletiaria anomala UBC 951]
MSSSPSFTPVHSFLGGLMLASSVHAMLTQLGSVLGISGFFHGAVRSFVDSSSDTSPKVANDPQRISDRTAVSTARLFTAGLLAGGLLLGAQRGLFESSFGVKVFDAVPPSPPLYTALFGILVGLGTKLGSGCTSGHFLCGLSRVSPRSIAATATFFCVAVAAHQLSSSPLTLQAARSTVADPVHLPGAKAIALLQLPALIYTLLVPLLAAPKSGEKPQEVARRHRLGAKVVSFCTGLHFAFGLALTGMLRSSKVLGFLSLSPMRIIGMYGWDPSLAMVALGGILPSAAGYFLSVKPRIDRGGKTEADQPMLHAASPMWRLPKSQIIDAKLIGGAALFGAGWGLSGLCPGPAIVSLGAAFASGQGLQHISIFCASMAAAGQLASLLT